MLCKHWQCHANRPTVQRTVFIVSNDPAVHNAVHNLVPHFSALTEPTSTGLGEKQKREINALIGEYFNNPSSLYCGVMHDNVVINTWLVGFLKDFMDIKR